MDLWCDSLIRFAVYGGFLLSSNAMMPRFFGSEQEYRLYNITSSAFFQLSIFI